MKEYTLNANGEIWVNKHILFEFFRISWCISFPTEDASFWTIHHPTYTIEAIGKLKSFLSKRATEPYTFILKIHLKEEKDKIYEITGYLDNVCPVVFEGHNVQLEELKIRVSFIKEIV